MSKQQILMEHILLLIDVKLLKVSTWHLCFSIASFTNDLDQSYCREHICHNGKWKDLIINEYLDDKFI